MDIISEETQDHFCRQVKKYRLNLGILWVFDGYEWYPLKPENDIMLELLKYKKILNELEEPDFFLGIFQQPTGNRNKTTDNETEPEITPTKTEILV